MVAECADYYFAGQQYKHDEVMFGYYEDDESTYLALFFMEEDENDKLTLSENTLILNTATGEFTVSEYIE